MNKALPLSLSLSMHAIHPPHRRHKYKKGENPGCEREREREGGDEIKVGSKRKSENVRQRGTEKKKYKHQTNEDVRLCLSEQEEK